jgi:nucleoid-associated protein YgaU
LSVVCLTASACRRPQLAARPLTQQELNWADAISSDYPAWEPPYQPRLLPVPARAYPLLPAEPLPPVFEDLGPAPGAGPALIPADSDEIELLPIDGGQAPAPAPVLPSYETYVVRKGDTLSGIARRYYGTALEWRRLADVNRDVLASPDQLRPGMELKIPRLPTTP